MPDIPRHSHPRRSIYIPGGRYFVTTVVQGRAPLLNHARVRFHFLRALTVNSIAKDFGVNALAILPDHVHLLLMLGRYGTSTIMHAVKGSTSRNVNMLNLDEKFVWQRSFRDHLIRSEDDYQQRLDYLLTNPEHHGVEGFTWAAPLRLSSAEEELYDRLTAILTEISLAKKRQTAARTPDDKIILQKQIDTTDRQIDKLVYELYGLTEEEIKVVERG